MIKLTAPSGRAHYYAPDLIIRVAALEDETVIWIASVERSFTVTESPETVARLITEYKQRQMRLQAAYAVQYSDIGDLSISDMIDELESEDKG